MRLILTFGVLFLISAIQAQDLECYVCTDCETNYENLKGTCSGSGEESGSGSGEESGSGSGEESGSGSGEESGGGSGEESGGGSGEESGGGSGEESGGGSGEESGSGSGEESDGGTEGDDGQNDKLNFRVASSDENINLRSDKRFENTDYYSVQMADNNGDKTMSRKLLTRFARSTRNDDTLEARCVVTSYEVNSTTKIKRGCSYGSGTDVQKCQSLLGVNYTETPSRCSVCAENLCNTAYKSYGSFHLQFAFIALIIGVFINA